MEWIVMGEESGRVKLISKRNTNGILPKGSFLTAQVGNASFVLRVDESAQSEVYHPSPLIADLDLTPLQEDRECRNLIHAYRVCELSARTDGLLDFLPPQTLARRSSQAEIDKAIGGGKPGVPIFLATIQSSRNQLLRDEEGRPITAKLPNDFFFYQTLICGKTGSGKTVASKYLAQYFVESLNGAVLAINVKEVDLLKLNRPSTPGSQTIEEEWRAIGSEPHGVTGFRIYNPSMIQIDPAQGVDPDVCESITLDIARIDPESLVGLMPQITDIGAQSLPGIFRKWRTDTIGKGRSENLNFQSFVEYYSRIEDDDREVELLNAKGDVTRITLHKGTFDSVLRALAYATDFFDAKGSRSLTQEDILQPGKLSVINVAGTKGIEFGSVFLRNILHDVVEAKRLGKSTVPMLVVIDEVHQFYGAGASREALGDLDTICRTGRSSQIGVIFSTQTPSDMPSGLSSVINTRILFKSEVAASRQAGVNVSAEEMEGLTAGFALASVHDLSLAKVVKFPLSFAGVVS